MKYNVLAILALAVLLHGCLNQDDFTNYSTLVATDPGIVTPSAVMATEGDEIEVTIMLSAPQVVDIFVDLKIDTAASTATPGVDWVLETESPVRIPAHQTSFKINLEALSDFPPEGTETAVIKIATEDAPNRQTSNETLTVSIDDLPGEDLQVVYDWGDDYDVTVMVTGTAAYGGPFDLITGAPITDGAQTLNGCAFADIDMLVINDEFTTVYGASARTVACPEVVELTATGVITNGGERTDTFYVLPEMYLNWGDSEFTSAPEPLNITATMTKENVITETHVQSDAVAFTTATPGDFGSFGSLGFMHFVIRDNGVWTIYEDGTFDLVFMNRAMQALEEIKNGDRVLRWEDGTIYEPKSYEQ